MSLKTKLIIVGIVIVLLIILGFIFKAIDTDRVERGEMPAFCIKMADVGDGSEIYMGLRI